MSQRPGKVFRRTGNYTEPNADDTTPAPHPEPDVQTSSEGKRERTAYTWRITAQQAHQLDALSLKLRTDLGIAKLDRAAMLAALVDLADTNPGIYGALFTRLQDVTTSPKE